MSLESIFDLIWNSPQHCTLRLTTQTTTNANASVFGESGDNYSPPTCPGTPSTLHLSSPSPHSHQRQSWSQPRAVVVRNVRPTCSDCPSTCPCPAAAVAAVVVGDAATPPIRHPYCPHHTWCSSSVLGPPTDSGDDPPPAMNSATLASGYSCTQLNA